jgi:hypothetical protein
MGEVSTIGVDIAKSVFQIHGVQAGHMTCTRPQAESQKIP